MSDFFARFLLVSCFCVVGLPAWSQGDSKVSQAQLQGRPGYLIISTARDSTAGFQWRRGPGPNQKSLVWDSGQLVCPATVILEPFGADDLGISTTSQLQGSSGGGALAFRDGRFTVDQPLLLTDGNISLYLAAGELEIRGAQVRYLPPSSEKERNPALADPMAGFLFLAGIVLLIVVLMRRARLRSKAMKR